MTTEIEKMKLFDKILLDVSDEMEDLNLDIEKLLKLVYLAGYEEGYSDGWAEKDEEL